MSTPRTNLLEETRIKLNQPRSAPYGDALRLSRTLETELALANAENVKLRKALAELLGDAKRSGEYLIYAASVAAEATGGKKDS